MTHRIAFAVITCLVLSVPARISAQEGVEPTPEGQGETAEGDQAPPAPDDEEQAPAEAEAEAEIPDELEEEVPPEVLEAEERLERGIALMEESDYDAALADFERAYELVGEHPTRYQLLYNIGKAHEKRFRYDLALEYYARFLDEGGPDVPHRAIVEATMSTLEGLLATLIIETNVGAAEVWVDDRHVGDAPGRVLIPGGRHIVELRAEGYTDDRQEVQIAPREEQTLSFELDELAEEYRGITPVFFWSSAGVAVVSLITGSIFGILAVAERNSVDDALNDPVMRFDRVLLEDKKQRIDDLALTADVFFGAALLFGATSVVLALFTDWGDESEDATGGDEGAHLQLHPTVSPDSAGVVVGGSF